MGGKMKVESDIILPKMYLMTLAEDPPGTLDELRRVMKDSPSRFEKFGMQILKALGAKYAN